MAIALVFNEQMGQLLTTVLQEKQSYTARHISCFPHLYPPFSPLPLHRNNFLPVPKL